MDYKAILKEDVAKQKENTRICNEFLIDVQVLSNLSAKVFNSASQGAPEYNDACDCLRELCDQIGPKALEFKQRIPVANQTNEVS